MKFPFLLVMIVLSATPAFACMEQTFINDDNYESTKHPFKLEWNEGYLIVTLVDQMADGCGKYQRSGVGNDEGPLEGFEPEDSEYSHDYFFFNHQIKEKKLVFAGWYDCDGCNGNTKVYVLELDKIEKMKSANKAVDTTRAKRPELWTQQGRINPTTFSTGL